MKVENTRREQPRASLRAGLSACPLCPHATHPDPWCGSQHPVPCFAFFSNISAAPLTAQGCIISLLRGECKQGTASTAPSHSPLPGAKGHRGICKEVFFPMMQCWVRPWLGSKLEGHGWGSYSPLRDPAELLASLAYPTPAWHQDWENMTSPAMTAGRVSVQMEGE